MGEGCAVRLSSVALLLFSCSRFLLRRVARVVHKIKKHAAEILRHNVEFANRFVVLFFNGDIESNVFRA